MGPPQTRTCGRHRDGDTRVSSARVKVTVLIYIGINLVAGIALFVTGLGIGIWVLDGFAFIELVMSLAIFKRLSMGSDSLHYQERKRS